MSDSNAESWINRLIDCVAVLASTSDAQAEWMLRNSQGIDDMRMNLFDVGSFLFPLYRESHLIDLKDEASVLALEDHLNSVPGNVELFHNWSKVKNAPFWERTRDLASVALVTLQRLPSDREIPN